MRITKAKICGTVAKKFSRTLEPWQIRHVVDAFIEEVKHNLELGNRVNIQDFCSFVPYVSIASQGYDINKKRIISIPESKRIRVIFAKKWKGEINSTDNSSVMSSDR